ncbi:heterokaryon incompatibility protein, partial [Colletotrichum asianum]
MLCAVCLKSLESYVDPSSVEIVGVPGNARPPEGVAPITESQRQRHARLLSDPERRFDRDEYAYGHHKTPESWSESAAEGCVICSSLPVRTEYTEGMATLGYFTWINICLSLETHTGKTCLNMYIICGNYSYERYGRFLSYSTIQRRFNNMISEFSDAPGTWATIQHWMRSCDDKHSLCKVQSTFIPTRLLKLHTSGG